MGSTEESLSAGYESRPIERISKTEWIPFAPVADYTPVNCEPDSSAMAHTSTGGAPISLELNGLWLETIDDREGDTWSRARVPGFSLAADALGEPLLPMKELFLEIPCGVTASLSVLTQETEEVELPNRLFPAQLEHEAATELIEEARTGGWAPAEEAVSLVMDHDIYSSVKSFPEGHLQMSGPFLMRGRRLVCVRVYPLRYHPAAGILTAATRLSFRIAYAGEITDEAAFEIRSRFVPEAEAYAESLIDNYTPPDMLEAAGLSKTSSRDAPSEPEVRTAPGYLIIAAKTFLDNTTTEDKIEEFAEWKRDKGYRTWIISTDDIVATSTISYSDIAAYIRTNTTGAAPLYPNLYYILLVGECRNTSFGVTLDAQNQVVSYDVSNNTSPVDSTLVPAKEIFERVTTAGRYKIYASDEWYSYASDPNTTGTGGAHYAAPSFVVGRISAMNGTEVVGVFDKLLQYDSDPFPVGTGEVNWYKRALGVGYFQDEDEFGSCYGDGDDQSVFCLTVMATHGAFLSMGWDAEKLLGRYEPACCENASQLDYYTYYTDNGVGPFTRNMVLKHWPPAYLEADDRPLVYILTDSDYCGYSSLTKWNTEIPGDVLDVIGDGNPADFEDGVGFV